MRPDEAIFGEDTITANVSAVEIQTIAARMRSSSLWEEVVPGMADITVKYDPATTPLDTARQHFDTQISVDTGGIETAHSRAPALLAARFDGIYAPDAAKVCEALGIAVNDLAHWLQQRRYTVSMMGFQPGFAYLADSDGADLPAIARLETPRQRVAAGSIGFLGGKACIYALDGPGGWPIIGRVTAKLFDPERGDNPALLAPAQQVQFTHGD